MNDLGKLLVAAGIVLGIVGAVMWKTGGLGPLGRRGETGYRIPERAGSKPLSGIRYPVSGIGTFSFPLATCLLLSILLSLLAWLLRK